MRRLRDALDTIASLAFILAVIFVPILLLDAFWILTGFAD
jgi:hypothetical protein